ncbi:MAG: SpoIIE family protein phosphatase [Bacteroidales bacterium]|nr:SpoIIE family protein phosphatase [Bacteroidales bacterium]MDT8429980.1 SpoIIE family protein phosphatase [Bacteroidales bacterium]
MKRFTGLILTFLSLCCHVHGQVNPYVHAPVVNYPAGITNGSEQNWAITEDNRGVIYVGNDDKGVLEYDGSEWRNIPIPNKSIVRSLACSEDGTVYVGAVSEIGYLAPDAQGNMQYHSLVHHLDSTGRRFFHVWKTYCTDDKVYFHSQKHLFIYHPEKDSLSYQENSMNVLFGFFENDHFYQGDFAEGLIELMGDSVAVPAKNGDFYSKKNIFGLTSYDEERILIGVNYQDEVRTELSLYNTETGAIDSTFGSPEALAYLSDNYLTHLLQLSSGSFAASTVAGGIVVLDRDGEIVELITKDHGLQSQTIFNAYQPPDNYPFSHVWTALGFGVARIDFTGPLRSFTEESGHQGLIHCIEDLDGRLHIGTTNGIYAYVAVNNLACFEKIGEDIQRNVWDFSKFTLQGGEQILLAIGEDGLFEVHADERVVGIKEMMAGDIKEEDKTFWGYKVITDPHQSNQIYIGRESSIVSLVNEGRYWRQLFFVAEMGSDIRSLAKYCKDTLWFGSTQDGLGYITPLDARAKKYYLEERSGLPEKFDNHIFAIDNRLLVGTTDGVYTRSDGAGQVMFSQDTLLNSYLPDSTNKVLNIYEDHANALWISFENNNEDWMVTQLIPRDDGSYQPITRPFQTLHNFSSDAFHSTDTGGTWFTVSSMLYHYNRSGEFREGTFNALLRKVTIDNHSIIYNGAHHRSVGNNQFRISEKQSADMLTTLHDSINNIEFRWSAPYYHQPEETEFRYFLEGFSKDTSSWEKVLYQDFTNLRHGSYTFHIWARNVYGDISSADSFSFEIAPPWYLTFFAIVAYFIIAVYIIYLIILLYTRRLKNENIRLEGIIEERTTEIRKQKEELTDSIEYASRIQRALLPPEQMLVKQGLEHFILFRPRDIVSGDFYWFGRNNGKIFIVAADCTGHGVPGAFMSMLGISFLDEIVIKSGITETNKILDALRNHVITSLRQTGQSLDESTKDGMDLSMVAIDDRTKHIQYSGAYNPLYVVRRLTREEKEMRRQGKDLDLDRGSICNNEYLLYQVKADHMPIGISEKAHEFNATTIVEKDVAIYLFSDGYVDQFGGPLGKKYMSRNFKRLLLDIQDFPMQTQKEKLQAELTSWMGNISQIDDILVLGIKP